MSIKQQIYNSIILIVNKEGFHNTPMSRIANEANVSPGSIYNYFKNKDDVIRSLYLSIYSELGELISEKTVLNIGLKDQYLTYWLEIYRFFIKNIEKYSYVKQFENSTFYNSEMKETSRKVFEPVMTFLKEGVDNGKLKDTDPLYLLMIMKANILVAVELSVDGLVHREGLEEIINISWDSMHI